MKNENKDMFKIIQIIFEHVFKTIESGKFFTESKSAAPTYNAESPFETIGKDGPNVLKFKYSFPSELSGLGSPDDWEYSGNLLFRYALSAVRDKLTGGYQASTSIGECPVNRQKGEEYRVVSVNIPGLEKYAVGAMLNLENVFDFQKPSFRYLELAGLPPQRMENEEFLDFEKRRRYCKFQLVAKGGSGREEWLQELHVSEHWKEALPKAIAEVKKAMSVAQGSKTAEGITVTEGWPLDMRAVVQHRLGAKVVRTTSTEIKYLDDFSHVSETNKKTCDILHLTHEQVAIYEEVIGAKLQVNSRQAATSRGQS